MRSSFSIFFSTNLAASTLFLTITAAMPSGVFAKTSKEVAQIAIPLTVQINTPLLSGGSGILISKQGNIYSVLTANHVVKRTDLPYTIRTNLNKEYRVSRIQSLQRNENESDLAVVTFESFDNYPTSTIGDSDQSVIGSDIYVIGFPATTGRTGAQRDIEFTSGIVTSRPQSRPQGYTLRYNAVTKGGMSGGPVFDTDARLIGIHGLGDIDGDARLESGSIAAIKTGFNAGIPVNTFVSMRSQLGLNDVNVAIDSNPSQSKPAQVQSPQTAKDYYAQGLSMQDTGQRGSATNAFSKSPEIDPNNPIAIYQRGLSRYYQNDNQGALSDFSQAIQLNSNYGDAYYQRAVVRYELGEKQGALTDFTESARLAPDAATYYNLGITRQYFKDRSGASEAFSEAVRLKPDFIAAYLNKAIIRRLGLGQLAGAIEDLNQAIQVGKTEDINYSRVIYMRGLFRRDNNDPHGGLEDLQKAAEIFNKEGNSANYAKAIDAIQRLQKSGILQKITPASSPQNLPVF